VAEGFARNGLLVRYFEQPEMLRFGLPASNRDWERLERAMMQLG